MRKRLWHPHYCPKCGSNRIEVETDEEGFGPFQYEVCYSCGYTPIDSYPSWNRHCGELLRTYKPMLRRLLKRQWKKRK